MALSIQAGTGSEGLCRGGSCCERGAEEVEVEGREGLGTDARLGVRGVIGELGIFGAGVLMVEEFPSDASEGAGC